MLLETESREVDTRTEDLGLSQNTDTTNSVNLHLHIWITVGVAEVCQMRSPSSVLCVSFDNDSVFIEGVGERERGLGFLPGVQVIGLLSTEPVREWAPDVCSYVLVVAELLGTLEPTWYNDVLVVSHQILKDSERCCFDIDISPVYPT